MEDLKNKRARIIIADVVDDIARVVMCEAYKLKMTAAQGYVWFLPMWLSANWYDTNLFNANKTEIVNCTTQEMIKVSKNLADMISYLKISKIINNNCLVVLRQAISGYFAMTHAYFASDDSIMQENITVGQWRKNYLRMAHTPSDYAGFAYDAVWTYALALDKLSKTDPEALSDLHSENTTK